MPKDPKDKPAPAPAAETPEPERARVRIGAKGATTAAMVYAPLSEQVLPLEDARALEKLGLCEIIGTA